MATADQVKALISSHLEDDEERFYAVALQVAARSARQGHGKVAVEIKALIDEAKGQALRRKSARPIPISTPKGELAGLLAVSYPDTRLSDMVLEEDVANQLHRLLKEHRGQSKLRAHGLSPRRKILLVGQPGTGKTMTASALAGELHLPLYVIVLDGIISKYMGETAAKLRLIFDALSEQRGVYLFDEFDALGAERGSGNDVGEIRRVLNSFLQFLEQDDSESIIVAATNHPQMLDNALFRRFDDMIHNDLPTEEQAEAVLRNRLSPFATQAVDWGVVVSKAEGLSHADVTKAALAAARHAVLDDMPSVTTKILVDELGDRRRHRAL